MGMGVFNPGANSINTLMFRLLALITLITCGLRAQVPASYQGGALPSPAPNVGRTILVANADASGNTGTGTYLFTSTGSTWTAQIAYQGGSLPSPTVMVGRSILANNSDASGNAGAGTYLLTSNGATWTGVAVNTVATGGGGGTWGSITGTLSSQTDLQTALNAKQNTLTLPLSVANGGTGTTTPGIVAGTNITVTGTWPNQTVTSSGGATTLSGDVTGSSTATVVGKINGVSLAGLSTGIVKNTTTTGVPSIAVAADFPTLNQNTTGTASNVTGTVAVANGGTGTTTPGIVAGTNVTVTGTWPNQTINSSGAGGSSTWNGITNPTGNQALSMGSNTSTWTYGATTSTANLFTLQDTTNNTGTGYVATIGTASGSAANPLQVLCKGAGCMTILANGQVGIGVSPTNPLDVLSASEVVGNFKGTTASLRSKIQITSDTNVHGYFAIANSSYSPVGGAGAPGSTLVGADNDLLFLTGGNGRWQISSAGHLLAANEVSLYNIGASGANRPGNIYVQKKVVASNFVSSVNAVTFSATPTFDLSLGDVQTMTLTGNVTTMTISNISAGQTVTFDFVQDASGNRTVAWPSSVHSPTTPGTVASKHNLQQFYSPDGTNLYAVAAGVTNQ
jgi:hypothetical protein